MTKERSYLDSFRFLIVTKLLEGSKYSEKIGRCKFKDDLNCPFNRSQVTPIGFLKFGGLEGLETINFYWALNF